MWNIPVFGKRCSLCGSKSYIYDMSYSQNGQYLTTAQSGFIRLWDLTTEMQVAVYRNTYGYFHAVSMHPVKLEVAFARESLFSSIQVYDFESETESGNLWSECEVDAKVIYSKVAPVILL